MYSKNHTPEKYRQLCWLAILALFFTACQTPSVLVTSEQRQGDEAYNTYDYEEALIHYQAMLDASSKLGIYRNAEAEAQVHRKMADTRVMLGQYDRAFEHLEASHLLDSTAGNTLGVIDNTIKTGQVHLYMGQYRRGMEYLEKSLDLGEGLDESLKNTNRLRSARTQLILGQYKTVLGKLKEGELYVLKALSLFNAIPDPAGQAEALMALGQISLDLGMPGRAEAYLAQSLEAAEKASLKPIQQFQTLGELKATHGEFEEALRLKTSAADMAEEVQIVGQQIWTMIGMGDLYFEIGDEAKGLEWYQKVISLKNRTDLSAASLQASLDLRLGSLERARSYFQEVGSETGLGLVYLRVGALFIDKGEADSAQLHLHRARQLFSRTGQPFGEAVAELSLGRLFAMESRRDSAIFYLEQSRSRGNYPEISWQVLFYTGMAEENAGKPGPAIDAYRQAIDVIEEIRGNFTLEEFKTTYLEDRQQVYERLIRLLIDRDSFDEAYLIAERARARAFLDMIGNRNIEYQEESSDDWTLREQELRFRLQKLHKMLSRHGNNEGQVGDLRTNREAEINNELDVTRKEYSEVLTRLKLANPDHLSVVSVNPFPLEEVRASLDEKSCMVVYWTLPEKICIWVLSREQLWFESSHTSSEAIEEWITQARRFIAGNSMSRMEGPLKDLYNVLIEPVEHHLSGFDNWIIVPKGSMHFLPFQALMNSEGQFLVDQSVISYAPSASVWKLAGDAKASTGEGFLGMALGDLAIGNSRGLPGTRSELESISPLFTSSDTYYSEEATETIFKNTAGDKEFIHLATHGYTDFYDPIYSFLLFPPNEEDDGRLLLTEVMGRRLDASLVTLSACQTGLGNITEGDDLVSLNRAFIYAGSPAVISSLWDVSDYTTALLMEEFYRQCATHSFAKALTLAQRKVKSQFQSPSYWAPFVLNGNGLLKK